MGREPDRHTKGTCRPRQYKSTDARLARTESIVLRYRWIFCVLWRRRRQANRKGEPERLSAVPVSQNFFPLLGVQPLLGRQFSTEECKWNGPKAALLTHGLWERRFASDPRIVGKTIRLDDTSVTVVGVMPKSFDFGAIFAPGAHIDLFYPFALSKETNRWGNTLALVGRIKPGVACRALRRRRTSSATRSPLSTRMRTTYIRNSPFCANT